MMRIAAVAAISASLVLPIGMMSVASERSVRYSQAAEHSNKHSPEAVDTSHHHGDAPDRSLGVALKTHTERLKAGTRAELVFALNDATGQPIDQLVTHHGRKLHVVIVSNDMQVFGHIHPQDFGEPAVEGSAKVFFTFPQVGRYLVAVDFMTAEGAHDEQFVVEVVGSHAEPMPTAEAQAGIHSVKLEGNDRYTKPALLQDMDESGGYAVSLQQPDTVNSGEAAHFAYHFTKDGVPLTELRPYLDAPLHLAVVKSDLSTFLHTHGTLPESAHAGHGDHGSAEAEYGAVEGGSGRFGPHVAATVTFPEPGTYFLFAQAAHGERLLISRFPVQVE